MEKSFKITLSDGTKFENLRLNGNNYVSKNKITKNDFRGKLSKVIIEDETENTIVEYKNMELVQITKYEDGYYFILRELSQDEIDKITIQSNIEYLSMMTGVDLEEV